MRCPLCGSKLAVIKTVVLSDSMSRRTRACENTLCPYTDKTYEMLNVGKVGIMLDEVIELLRDIARTVGKDAVHSRIAKLDAELRRKKEGRSHVL